MAAVASKESFTVAEYLATSFEVDCDFVDGRLVERNLGDWGHSSVQGLVAAWLINHDKEWGTMTRPELRLQVLPTRFRVPDVMILRERPANGYVTAAPLACIEVLSPDDSLNSMGERVNDYLQMGVENVWIIDPVTRQAWICTEGGWNHPTEPRLAIPGTPIYIPLDEIFAGLDA